MRQRLGHSYPTMSRNGPSAASRQQQQPLALGLQMLRAAALLFLSPPWGAAGFDKPSQPSQGWLVDLIAVFYCVVKARRLLGRCLVGMAICSHTPPEAALLSLRGVGVCQE